MHFYKVQRSLSLSGASIYTSKGSTVCVCVCTDVCHTSCLTVIVYMCVGGMKCDQLTYCYMISILILPVKILIFPPIQPIVFHTYIHVYIHIHIHTIALTTNLQLKILYGHCMVVSGQSPSFRLTCFSSYRERQRALFTFSDSSSLSQNTHREGPSIYTLR